MIFGELHKLCRLCFNKDGENDVTTTPILLEAIKTFYNIEVRDLLYKFIKRHEFLSFDTMAYLF